MHTEQGTKILQQSRLDSGSRQIGIRLLEIAAHNLGIDSDKLAHFSAVLNDVSLTFLPFAIKAKEYAISAKDSEKFLEFNDSEAEDH